MVPGDSEAVGVDPTTTGCDHASVYVCSGTRLASKRSVLEAATLTGGVFPNVVFD